MKKLIVVMLIITAIFSTSIVALGLNSPSVSKGSGVITGMFASEDYGLLAGIEYGLSQKFAAFGRVGLDDRDFTILGIKYEMSPTFALIGGVFDYKIDRDIDDNDPFFGINGSLAFDRDFMGILEAAAIVADDVEVFYEAGLKYNINKQIDIRGGIIGTTFEGDDTVFELGAGYKF